ncbi:MAG: RagB/SusD family nutrient uptake outer membrane protein [Bacteroidota bacterium]
MKTSSFRKMIFESNKLELKILLMILVFSCSCKKFILVPPPTTQVVTTSVFADASSATAAQLGVYIKIRSSVANFNFVTGISSDELFNYNRAVFYKDAYVNTLNVQDASSLSTAYWNVYYNAIYQENAIIENLEKSPVNLKIKQQLTGEAYFTRAYNYLMLLNLYGGVPLVTSTDYTTNTNKARSTTADVYTQIVADLKIAHSLLNSNYVDASDTVVTTDRVRPTTWAADALLARVYLDTKDWKDAETQASIVINNTEFNLPSDLTTVFKNTSREAILQFIPDNTKTYSYNGGVFVVSNGVPTSCTISNTLLGVFEPGDQRKVNWISTYTNPTTSVSYTYASKYRRSPSSTGNNDEYDMVLRLGEQYLIRSEARAQQNNISGTNGALSDLNAIRHRAGLGDYSDAIDQTSVLAAIAHERQVELFTEGQRWVDLKRTGMIDAVMGAPGNACATKGGTWQSYQQLYPISLPDIQKAPNLTQAPGY